MELVPVFARAAEAALVAASSENFLSRRCLREMRADWKRILSAKPVPKSAQIERERAHLP